jgi:hypothetical protein
MINLSNVRLGFATNSSSCHSMIFLDEKQKEVPSASETEFGWEDFTLTTRRSKLIYFSVQLYLTLKETIPENYSLSIVKDITGIDLQHMIDEYTGIDHESVFSFPTSQTSNKIDTDFVKDLLNFIKKEKLIILGGNDNSGGHPLANENKDKVFFLPYNGHFANLNLLSRKDPLGFWTIFNKSCGTKIRMNFNSDTDPNVEITKSTFPDLVDLKITDFCDSNCNFCYQDSSTSGKHAAYIDIYKIIHALKEMKIFEVAIGGGEPTSHPDFLKILWNFGENNIVPNFSTRNLDWLSEPQKRDIIFKYCGSLAVSVTDREDIENIYFNITKLKKFNPYDKIKLQHVLGTTDEYGFTQLCQAINFYGFNVTFLGYKETGRGKNNKPFDHKNWIKVVLKNNLNYFGIDTSIAKQFEKELELYKVSPKLYDTKDGAFSMYIDGVNKNIGPSSYCSESELISFSDEINDKNHYKLAELFLNKFAGF